MSLPTRNTLVSSQAGFDPGSLQTPRTTPGFEKSWPTHPRPWEPSSYHQACLQRYLRLPCQSCQKVHQGQELSHLELTKRNCIVRREQSQQILIGSIKNHLGGQSWTIITSYVGATNIEVTGGKEAQELSLKSAKKLRWPIRNNSNKDYNKIKGAVNIKKIVK